MATVKKTGTKATAASVSVAPSTEIIEDVRRRDFINIAAVSFAGVGAAAVVLPALSTMGASADVLAMASIEVDISKVEVGQAIKLSWRKQPVFVRNLTAKEVAEANAVNVSTLRDPQTLAERTKPGKENWLVTMGVCTHLGCVPLGAASGEFPAAANLADISVHAMDHITTAPRASARVLRRLTFKFRNIVS